MNRYLFFIGLLYSIIFTGCGGGGGSSTPVVKSPPIFTSTNSINVDENQTSVLTITTDTSTVNYSISGTDSASFNIGATNGVLTFKNAPDYETKNSYFIKVTAKDNSNNSVEQDITITINDLDDTLEIRSTMYDDKQTSSVNDDVLYIYFDKPIDQTSINTGDASSNFTITGTGVIGSASNIVYQSDFNRLKIELNSTGTPSSVFSSSDTITNAIIKGSLNQDFVVGTYTINKKDVFSLLKTGQTTSYAANDDGALQSDITRSYTRDNTNEIVTDNVTKLMWQDNSDVSDFSNRLNWEDAKTYCENLSLGGFNDWILPNMEQLVSITDLGRDNPSIDPTFVNIVNTNYWSSNSDTFIISNGLNVTFTSATDSFAPKTSTIFVRCVHPLL